MSRFRIPLVLACLLVPSLIPAVGPDAEPQTKLSPVMRHLLEDDAGPVRVWIFFVDKGLAGRAAREEAIADVAASYDRRAVERRRLRGLRGADGGPLFDSRDLPVHEPYVDQVAATGARVRIRSRWVNAVSAVATHEQIDAIAALPAVTKVQPVARSRRPEISEAQAAALPGVPVRSLALDYGRSTDQLTQINLIALHEAGYTGEGVIVGILDTGFRRDHEAFHQPGHELDVIAEYDFVDNDPDTSNQPGDPASQHSHGTLILGTLGSYYPGELVGGAFGASFALAKTEDTTDEYPAEEDNFVAGLEFLEANGVDMTTSSLGYIDWYTQAQLDGETAVTTIAVNTASDFGVHTVNAAGNEYHDTDPATSSLIAPSDAFSVITAGAVTSSGSISSFSSDGPTADGRVKPELLALGSGTDTISSSSTTAFTTADGTSLSTPLVAAAVACLIQANPNWTVQVMREELFKNADYDPGGLGFDPMYVRGYGIVDALATHVNAYTPAGFVLFQDDVYSCNDTLVITLRDDNVPGDPPTITLELSSATEVVPEIVTLTQVGPGLGRYQGTFPTSAAPPANGDGSLSVSHGDLVTASYTDADDGAGGTNVVVEDTADADCAAPVIGNVQVGSVTGSSAVVSWDTDELSDSLATYGELVPGTTLASENLVTAHSLELESLQECTVYLFEVSSTDLAGNATTDNNQGAFYEFATGVNNQPEYVSTDTPIPIVDNTTFTSVLTVTDDDTVLDVDVRLNATHTYTGDLDIFLIGPNDIRVELTSDNGGSGENFVDTIFDDEATAAITGGSAPFTGRYQPEGSLATLDGIPANGAWTLEVTDDAGADQGELVEWTLILTFEAQQCGPVAQFMSHQIEVDACSTGTAGLGNNRWEVGEQVEFSLEVKNDGTDRVTDAWVHVTPITAGITMLDDTATVGDLDPGISATTQPPHVIAQLTDALICGQTVDFQVDMISNEGTWPATFQQMVGEVIAERSGVTLSEDFSTGIPAEWAVIDRSRSGGPADGLTWYADSAADPAACGSTNPNSPIAGMWAAVDSSCTGGGDRMDEDLITPVMNFVDDPIVTLEFDHWFEADTGEIADVDVRSSLTGGQWVNVARFTGVSTANPVHEIIDISAQAGNTPDAQIRWHYYEAQAELYWYLDNVVVHFFAPELCLNEVCAPPITTPPPIPDGSAGGSPMLADRATPDGSEISIVWDDQCAPPSAKIVYGSLGQVSAYTISGSVCGIANPESWAAVPAGDLWFVVVGGDGVAVESSWGLATDGERNGLNPSGTCGETAKEITGSCP